MESLEDYDLMTNKLSNLEKEVIDLHERYLTVAETLRETQRYMVKLAQHQAIIADQISHWPYIAVERQTIKKLNKGKE